MPSLNYVRARSGLRFLGHGGGRDLLAGGAGMLYGVGPAILGGGGAAVGRTMHTIGWGAVRSIDAAPGLVGRAVFGAGAYTGGGVVGVAAGAARRHPFIAGTLGVGILAGGVGAGGLASSALGSARHIRNTLEAEHMAGLLLKAQSGPFGTGDRPWGLGPNASNTAGLSLAAHYATYRNKRLGALGLGLKYL